MGKIIGDFLSIKKTVMHILVFLKKLLKLTELKFWVSIGIGSFLTGLIFLTNSWHFYVITINNLYTDVINPQLVKSYIEYDYVPAIFLIVGFALLYLLFLIKVTPRAKSFRSLFTVIASITIAYSLTALFKNWKIGILMQICVCISISWVSYYIINGLYFTYKWLGEDSKNFIPKMTLVIAVLTFIFNRIF